jgi:hypothetical protein
MLRSKYIFLFVILCITLLTFCLPTTSYAYIKKFGKWNLNTYYTGGYSVGHNITKGYINNLVQYVDTSHYPCVVVPDDGCTWVVDSVFLYSIGSDGDYGVATYSFSVTTGGSFEGPSIQDAVTAANAANTAAGQAKTSADNASSYASTAANRTIYSGQSAAYWSNSANTNASNAKTSADAAKSSADSAKTSADTASARVWDTTTGKSAATLARESRDYASTAATQSSTAATQSTTAATQATAAATNSSNAYNAVNNVNGNTITAVRDAAGTVLSEARQSKTNSLNAYNEAFAANNKLNTLQTQITNIENNLGADTSPPTVKIRTVSGAAATSGNSIQAVLDISDNAGSTFTYSLDGISYVSVPADRIISLPVTGPGSNVIIVRVKDEAGNIGTTSITIRKL